MSGGRVAAVAVGLGLDATFGEPPAPVHPVAWFGTTAQALERVIYVPRRTAGMVYLGVATTAAASVGFALDRLLGRRPATAVAVGSATAHRMLVGEVAAVAIALDRGDLATARLRVSGLVGRDVSALGEAELARATIESLAENTVDAVTATTFWAVVGGAPAACAHRAINTLDAMVGHRSPRYERFGWAAARADDLANWIPARLTVLAVAIARPRHARAVADAVRREAGRHPSPNGGVIEAAFAAALDVQLGGTNRYGDRVEDRGLLGSGPPPTTADIGRAITLSRHCVLVVTALTLAGATVAGLATRPVRRARR